MARTIPAPAAAFGLTGLLFLDDFDSLSTIDQAKTYTNGFKWYPTNWPSIFGNPATFGTNGYTISNSVLTLTNTGLGGVGNTWNSNISTVGYLSASDPRTVGRTFDGTNGLYFSSSMRFNLPAADTGIPGWYLMDLTTILSLIDQTTHTGGEIDLFEAQTNRLNQTSHTWTNWDTTTSEQRPAGGAYSSGIVSVPSQLDVTQFHDYGMLVVPDAMNNGHGFIRWYIDGNAIGGDGPSFPATMTVYQEAQYVIQIVAHPTRSLDIGSVEVWGQPYKTRLVWS